MDTLKATFELPSDATSYAFESDPEVPIDSDSPRVPIGQSPDTYLLVSAVEATPAQRRILSALTIRKNGAGVLPTLRTATRVAAAAAARHPSKRASEWVDAMRGLLDRLTASAPSAPWLDMLCPVVSQRLASDVLASPVRCTLPPEARARLDAWLGIHVFHALARGCVLSNSVTDDWETLRRTGTPRSNTPAAWVEAAKRMPLDATEFQQVLPGLRNARLLDTYKWTLLALAADLPAPDTVVPAAAGSNAYLNFKQVEVNIGADEPVDDEGPEDTESDEQPTSSDEEPRGHHSMMGLLLHRALHAAYRGQFGITAVYGELPPQNLRRICMALAGTLASGAGADRTRAAVAEVLLKLPLSPKRVLTLSLVRNDDVWLDFTNGSICWNFDRILESRASGAGAAGRQCKPIRIRLSDRCTSHLRQLAALKPAATSLLELVGGADDAGSTNAWIEAFGLFLRDHGDDNYKAYSVRFARSYRSVYLDRGHGAVAAALLGLDFATVPAGMLHYVSLSEEQLTAWQLDVDRYLGLHWTHVPTASQAAMLGSPIHLTVDEFRDGWASLQIECGAARNRLEGADSATAVAEAWTSLSIARLTSFVTLTLQRAQRFDRLTAGALLTSPDFGLLGDKDVDPYRTWRAVPYGDLTRQILHAVRSDIEVLRHKAHRLELDLRSKLGQPGSKLPNRLCLFFGLAVAAEASGARLHRVALKRLDVQAVTARQFFERPANIGRHFFISALAAASVDTWLIAAITGHGHIGAEVFSDSMAVAPALALHRCGEALKPILSQLQLMQVPNGQPVAPALGPAARPAPSPIRDPYLHPHRGNRGRILLPAADPLTLPSLQVVGRVEALLVTHASITELTAGTTPTCMVTLDGIHPTDLLEAQAQMPASLVKANQGVMLMWARTGCSSEILQPLNARTVVAVGKALDNESVCSDEQMRAAGAWIRSISPEVTWPEDDRDAFLSYCALAQRWHRFHEAPGTLAASSRAILSATANRESVLRLAQAHPTSRFEDLPFTPIRRTAAMERVQLRSALAELRRQLGVQGNTRVPRGEEQRRARDLLSAIDSIDTTGDIPARRAKEVLQEECRNWIDDTLRASGAGRQYSSLRTYGTQVFMALGLVSTTDDMSLWIAPDFVHWFSRAKQSIGAPGADGDAEMVGLRRFLLVGRDRLGWDVPDELLRGVTAFTTDGQRKAAAATLVYSFDYTNARQVIERRLVEWPVLLGASRIDLHLREAVPLRSGERATLSTACLTADSDRLILKNAGFSDKKSPAAIRLCTLLGSSAADVRQYAAGRAQGASEFLFLDQEGTDWSVFDSIDQVENEALTLVTGDPSYRPHCGRASAGCHIAWPGWESAAQAIFHGRAVSAARTQPERLDFSGIVRATMECGQGHASTFLTYYASVWPLLRAVSANRRLAAAEPDDAFITAALGSTDAVRAARSRAKRQDEQFSAWDVIARIAAHRCNLPALVRKQPEPVVATTTSKPSTGDAIARYVLARTTGMPRDLAAQRFGIAISLAETIESKLQRGKP